MSPEELGLAAWPNQVDGTIVAPRAHTCTSGVGAASNYSVVSNGLEICCGALVVVKDAPSSPHSPVMLELSNCLGVEACINRDNWKARPPRPPSYVRGSSHPPHPQILSRPPASLIIGC